LIGCESKIDDLFAQDKHFIFPTRTYQSFEKSIFVMKNLYRDKLELLRMVQTYSHIMVESKMTSGQSY